MEQLLLARRTSVGKLRQMIVKDFHQSEQVKLWFSWTGQCTSMPEQSGTSDSGSRVHAQLGIPMFILDESDLILGHVHNLLPDPAV